MKTWRLSETIEERDYFSNSFKGEIFLSFIVLKATEKCSSRLKEERETEVEELIISISVERGDSLLLIHKSEVCRCWMNCTSLRLGERIKMVVWSVLQDKVRTGREVGRRVQMSERATQSRNKTRNRNGEKKCILLLLLSQLQLCHLQVFIRFLLN